MAGTDPGHVNTAALNIPFTQLPLVTSLHTEFAAFCSLLLALMMGGFDLK